MGSACTHSVRNHVDYRRAAEALKAAQRAAETVPSIPDPVISAEILRLTNQNLEAARRRVAEVEADLQRRLFDLGDPPPTR